jgi:RNA polymerase-binding transcription factor DksA
MITLFQIALNLLATWKRLRTQQAITRHLELLDEVNAGLRSGTPQYGICDETDEQTLLKRLK